MPTPFIGSGLSDVIFVEKELETEVQKLITDVCQGLKIRKLWHVCYILVHPGSETLSSFF